MNLTIKGRNTEVTDALREYVEKRFDKLEKYFTDELRGTVTLIIERNEHIAEATIPINRFILRAEETSNDMYASIDSVVDKIERQVRKYKTRINRKGKQLKEGLDSLPLVPEVPEVDDKEFENDKVVKVKRFTVRPMDAEEAMMQMTMLDHDFFVYQNGESGALEVLYRRRDGKYGLLQPELN